MKKLIILISVLLLGFGIINYPKLSTTLSIASGFSAKNICSGHFVSGFSAESIATQALHPVNDIFSLLSYTVDDEKQTVSVDIFGLFEQQAIYRPGLGCALLASGGTSQTTTITPLIKPLQPKFKPWPLGSAAVELDNKSLDYDLVNTIIDEAFSEGDPLGKRNVKAVAIVYQGQLIAERYAADVSAETPLLSWSMAKSITNLQVGLLVKSGKLDLFSPANVPAWNKSTDPRSTITLDQLMRMSSGLEFNEAYGLNTDVSRMLSIEVDAPAFAASKSLIFDPDTHWSYSSGTTNIIAGIIKRTIGGDFQHYYEYWQWQLFYPLGIHSGLLETDPNDTFIGSAFFYANTRDWAKFGLLMLQDGYWNGVQLLPEGWVKYSTTATKTSTLNKFGAHFWLNRNPDDSTQSRKWPTVPEDVYYMGGYQGQYVVVIPSKELVIVRLGFTKPGVDSGIEQLISDIIAAVSRKPQ